MTPNALPRPGGAVLTLDDAVVDHVIAASRTSARGRMIQRLHDRDDAPLHRMLNAIQPGSYVRPHRHRDPPKPESWIVLRGRLLFAAFDDQGTVTDRLVLEAGTPQFGVDVEAGVFHTIAALAPDTVIFEVKPGPWSPATDKDFAPWAPDEGTPEAARWLRRFLATE